MDTEAVANVMADAHHRFQMIHPFKDTNGRTGRVLDHYVLWVDVRASLRFPGVWTIQRRFDESLAPRNPRTK
jgi:Fic family protein